MGGNIPVYGSNGIVGYHNEAAVEKPTVIVGRKGSIGEVHMVNGPSWPIDTTYYVQFKSSEVNLGWFYRLLKTLRLNELNRSAAIPGLNRNDFYRIKIGLPLIEDQIRIATLLSRVEALIATRRNNLQQLDDFLKSTFLEMFGIKSGSYKEWVGDHLVDHTKIVSGVTKGKRYKSNNLIETPYMRVANVQDGFLDLREIKKTQVSPADIEKYMLLKGDLLLTEGGDPDKLGRGYIWNGEIEGCIHQNHIFRVRVDDNKVLNPLFLSGLIGSIYGKSYFLRSAKQTTGIASINSTQLKKFPLILPPIALQNKYANVSMQVRGSIYRCQVNLSSLEELYAALSQKAFKGELDLSRIPLPEKTTPPNIP